MQTFGETLKAEREDRGLTLESVARTVGVDQERLRALERNDFAALPDEPTMMSCLHACADCLGVDAEMMIEDYVKERDRWLRQLDQAISEQSVEATPAAVAEHGLDSANTDPVPRGPRLFGALLVVAVTVILVAWWILSGNGDSPTTPAKPIAESTEVNEPSQSTDAIVSSPELPVDGAPDQAPAAAPGTPNEKVVASTAMDRPVERPVQTKSTLSPGLRIPDSGVGTGIDNRQLVGRGSRFSEGTSAWFWTHVEGGTRGDRIDHVWLHDGVETTRVSLNIGASRWRTQSTKLLGPGSVGGWAVEARDETGRVLVRHEFVVEPQR